MPPKIDRTILISLFFLILTLGVFPGTGQAHCDAKDGPVGKAATKALETDDFSKVRIWVGTAQEGELRYQFKRIKEARKTAIQPAKDVLEDYFIETAIRLHRAAEGLPFTGVREAGAPVPRDVKLADEAVETDNLKPLMDLLQTELAENLKKWFNKEQQARLTKDQSVEAGREWVDAYVKFVVYVHQLHQKIAADPAHGIEE